MNWGAQLTSECTAFGNHLCIDGQRGFEEFQPHDIVRRPIDGTDLVTTEIQPGNGILLIMENDRRDRSRVKFETPVILQIDNQNRIEGLSKNIGMKGLYVRSERRVPVGSSCDIDIILKGTHSNLVVQLKGSVIRQGESGIGIEFDKDMEWWAVFSMFEVYGRSQND